MISKSEITNKIKTQASICGFDVCKIIPAKVNPKHFIIFEDWVKKGFNAEMQYLESNHEVRNNPEILVPKAKSTIVLISSYFNTDKIPETSLNIAKYARSKDYHIAIKEKMNELLHYINTIKQTNGRCFVDSAPIPERSLASMAGMGFIGKNTCLINLKYGSWIFISSIIVDIELDFDNLETDNTEYCKNCTKCIDACPTNALKPYEIDSRLCISYHTIENRGQIPINVSDKITDQFFGCDICQDVCPYNSSPSKGNMSTLSPLTSLVNIESQTMEQVTNSKFKKEFGNTALYRTGLKKLKNNLTHLKPKTV